MNQIFAGAAALIFTVIMLGLGKRPRAIITQKVNSTFQTGLRQEEPGLVLKSKTSVSKKSKAANSETTWQPPRTVQERLKLQKMLKSSINSGPSERLKAVKIASQWGHRSVLPILRRGLKDSDLRVVSAATAGIQSYREVSSIKNIQETGRPPRNVALMR